MLVDVLGELFALLERSELVNTSLCSRSFHALSLTPMARTLVLKSEMDAGQARRFMTSYDLCHLPRSLELFLALPSSASFGWSEEGDQFSDDQRLRDLEERQKDFGDAWERVLSETLPYFSQIRDLVLTNASFEANILPLVASSPFLCRLTFRNCELKPLSQTTLDLFSSSHIRELIFEGVRTTNIPLRCIPIDGVLTFMHPLALANACSSTLRVLRLNIEGPYASDILEDLNLPHLDTLEFLSGSLACPDIQKILPFLLSCPSLHHLVVGELPFRLLSFQADPIVLSSLRSYEGSILFAALVLPNSPVETVHLRERRSFVNTPEVLDDGMSGELSLALPWIASLKHLNSLTVTLNVWNVSFVCSLTTLLKPTALNTFNVQYLSGIFSQSGLITLTSSLAAVQTLQELRIIHLPSTFSCSSTIQPKFQGFLVEVDDEPWARSPNSLISLSTESPRSPISQAELFPVLSGWKMVVPALTIVQFENASYWRWRNDAWCLI